MPEVIQEDTFDVGAFADELGEAAANRTIGTTLWFEDERVRVWEVRLEPGVRTPFHAHATPYFWTCVDAGTGRQRSPDGTLLVRRYAVGDTLRTDNRAEAPLIHDLENVGDTVLRFVTVELLDAG
jgi:beta-alanine degradation protein BauB